MPSSALKIRRPPRSTLFPYTTLFRSLLPGKADTTLLRSGTAILVEESGWHGSRDRKSTRLNSSHLGISYAVFCFKNTAPTEIYTLSLHDALPISLAGQGGYHSVAQRHGHSGGRVGLAWQPRSEEHTSELQSLRHLVCRLLL